MVYIQKNNGVKKKKGFLGGLVSGAVTKTKKRKGFRIPSPTEVAKTMAQSLKYSYQKYIRKDPRGKLTKK